MTSSERGPTPDKIYAYGSAAVIWFSMAMLGVCFLVWALTGRVEAIFVTTFGGLLGVGFAGRAVTTLRNPPAPPIPPADPPAVDAAKDEVAP